MVLWSMNNNTCCVVTRHRSQPIKCISSGIINIITNHVYELLLLQHSYKMLLRYAINRIVLCRTL